MRIVQAMISALVLCALAALPFVSSGCGSDDNSAAAGSCNANCDKQGAATGCSGDLASLVQTCKQACGLIMTQLSADCAAKAEAHYNCLAGLDYACASGGNLPQPQNADTCQAEIDAFGPCMQQQ